jgi:protein-tyrosine phosphatase|tara:strand:+ start:223 stop:675 length:453 start_codon:yes stop_codon:yes gene_type:complete
MKIKILMVCLGNICRSPLAEGILKSKIDSNNIFVDSAGTGHWHIGKKPDPRSIEVAKKHQLDITDQRARQFSKQDFDDFDYIFVMDNSNKKDILSIARNDSDKEKIHLILNEIFPNENMDVPDPYYGGSEGFQNVYRMLDLSCDSIANRL